MIKKNSWVLIGRVVLSPEERSNNIPEDTKKTPLKMWIKGSLLEDATLQETVKIKTKTGRIESGTLLEVNPTYHHTYGSFIPELMTINELVKTKYE
ncbi:MAG: 2-amino-4-oxopentanoate thiolase subunit OrtA [Bacilli bacterium]